MRFDNVRMYKRLGRCAGRPSLLVCCLLLGATASVKQDPASPASAVAASQRAAYASTAATYLLDNVERRGTCSPREPFAPPLVATLTPPGVLALDQRRGRVVVVSSTTTTRATVLSVAAYNDVTGAIIRARRIVTRPVAPVSPSSIFNDDVAVALDEGTGRIFVLHAPSIAGRATPGRVDVLDEYTLGLVRAVPVGGVARPPVVAERTARVFVASQRSGAVSVLDARDGRLLRTVSVARGPLGPTAAPVVDDATGRVFFAADTARDNLIVLDARSGSVLRRLTIGAFPQAIALDRGNGRVLVASGGSVAVLDARDGRLLRTAPLIGTPRTLLVDASAHHAFASYSDNVDISMLDTATGAVLRSTPVRLDHTIPGRRQMIDQAENEIYPLVDRIDERMRWVVVRVPQVMADDGPEQGPAQIAVLDSRTATRIHTVFAEPTWPDAVAVDDRRGRAFSDAGGAINVYDISCLNTYYIFGDMG